VGRPVLAADFTREGAGAWGVGSVRASGRGTPCGVAGGMDTPDGVAGAVRRGIWRCGGCIARPFGLAGKSAGAAIPAGRRPPLRAGGLPCAAGPSPVAHPLALRILPASLRVSFPPPLPEGRFRGADGGRAATKARDARKLSPAFPILCVASHGGKSWGRLGSRRVGFAGVGPWDKEGIGSESEPGFRRGVGRSRARQPVLTEWFGLTRARQGLISSRGN
jgi:hypothetical protein